MFLRIVYAFVVWVVVALVVFLLGTALRSVTEPTMHAIGDLMRVHAWLIGLVCALVYFFFGSPAPRSLR